MIQKNLKIGGLSISAHLREAGSCWLVFLHGLQSCKTLFDPLFQDPRFNEFSILAIDLVGFGHSSKPEDFSYDLTEQAEVFQKALESLGIQEMHLIGHSLGGMVGTLLLDRLGSKIISFINMEGNLVHKDCGLSAEVARIPYSEFQENMFVKIKSDLERSSDPGVSLRSQWIERIPDYAFYKTCQSIVTWSESKKLLEIFGRARQRKLYLCGERNRWKAEVLPKDIAVAEIPGAGHFMIMENAVEAYDKMNEFFLMPPIPALRGSLQGIDTTILREGDRL